MAYGAERGVAIVLQHHDDLLKTAAQTLAVLERIDSEWFGLNVDVGSLRTTDDPYAEIGSSPPTPTPGSSRSRSTGREWPKTSTSRRSSRILRDTGYRGYVPLETLGAGDPRPKLRSFLDRVREALAS